MQYLIGENPNVIKGLNLFNEAIDLCRNALQNNKIKDEPSYEYSIIQIFSSMIVTSNAIYILLFHGYPDDALGLCRKLYEGLVIVDTIINRKENDDNDLPIRFGDAPKIAALRDDYYTLKYALSKNPNDQYIRSQMEMIQKKSKEYLEKYKKAIISEFSDYWWSGYTSFSEMAKHSNFPKYYVYSLLSDKAHLNALGAIYHLDNSESGILLGTTGGGKEKPLWCATMFLNHAIMRINNHFPTICPQNVVSAFNYLFGFSMKCLAQQMI